MVEYITIKIERRMAEKYIDPFTDKERKISRADIVRDALFERYNKEAGA